MRRLDRMLAGVLAAAWLAFFGCITWLEWVRPKTPDPAHGFTRHLKGFQTIVYVTPADVVLRDTVSALAFALTVGVMALEAWRRR